MNELKMQRLPERTELWQQTLNWQPSLAQEQQFQQLYELILQANQHLNLTRITEPLDFWEKHLWDSLRGVASFLQVEAAHDDGKKTVIDIGTGAGFPGIPMAIALPHFSVTLLDSTRKKVAFLETTISSLTLHNASPLNGRAEQLSQQPQHYQGYDIALLRAVAAADQCAKYALPFLKPGGLAILYRGNWTREEETLLQEVLTQFNGQLESVEAFTTPVSQSVRHCLYLRKEN